MRHLILVHFELLSLLVNFHCLIGYLFIIAGIVTRRPLVLQLHKTEEGSQEYAEFLHLPKRRFTDFGMFSFQCVLACLHIFVHLRFYLF